MGGSRVGWLVFWVFWRGIAAASARTVAASASAASAARRDRSIRGRARGDAATPGDPLASRELLPPLLLMVPAGAYPVWAARARGQRITPQSRFCSLSLSPVEQRTLVAFISGGGNLSMVCVGVGVV